MNGTIRVFIRATSLPAQLTSLHYSYDYHYYLEKHFRDSYHWLREQGFSKGRIFEPDSAELLPVLGRFVEEYEQGVRFYDLNTVMGKVVGLRFGIWQTPAVMIRREKFIGLADCRRVLQNILQDIEVMGQLE